MAGKLVLKARRKYRNCPVTVDGIRFASKREAARWGELKLREQAGEIEGLRAHFRWKLEVNGMHVCDYEDDFSYFLAYPKGGVIVEDTKGVRTSTYRLKAKLMKACYGIDIREV